MHNNKRGKIRKIEVLTGIILILATLSLLISYLLNFEYISPEHSIEEDMNFLLESTIPQRISSIAWMTTALITLSLLPFYLITFYRFHRVAHIINGLLITIMATVFFRAALAGLSIVNIVESFPENEGIQSVNQVLSLIKDTILLIQIGVTVFGGYVFILSISRFRKARIPLFGTILLILSGPVLIVFIWMNPEHLILTSAMAVASIGLFITGTKLVNKGLGNSVKQPIL